MKRTIFGLLCAALVLASCSKDTPALVLPVISIENVTGITSVSQKDTIRLRAVVEAGAEGTIQWKVDGEVVDNGTNPILKFVSTTKGTHTVTLSATNHDGTNSKQIALEVYPQFRSGTWVLNEGNTGNETGSLTFISPQGVIEPFAYLGVNERLLGNVCMDMFICGGKMYIISQNGNRNKVDYPNAGDAYPNEEYLTVCNAETLVREATYSPAEISMPTHVAVLNEKNVFVLDQSQANNGIHLIDPKAGKSVLIPGTKGSAKNRMAVAGGKVFAIKGNDVLVLTADKTDGVAHTISMGAKVSGVVKSADGNLWVATSGTSSKIAKINPSDYSVIKENEVQYSLATNFTAAPSFGAAGDMIYYTDKYSMKICRHNFATGSDELLADVKTMEPNAGMNYNSLGVNPLTGEVVFATLKGYGMNYKINNIIMFDFNGASPAITANYPNANSFPAGVYFTGSFE